MMIEGSKWWPLNKDEESEESMSIPPIMPLH
jgi:hypothetical protein